MSKVPTILENCTRFYDHLDAKATDGIFVGHVTKEFKQLGLPLSYYSKVRRYLLAMGCVSIQASGAQKANSVWTIERRPSKELLNGTDPDTLSTAANDRDQLRLLQQRVLDLEGLLGEVYEKQQSHEHRLSELETTNNKE